MPLVFVREASLGVFQLLGMYCDAPYEVSVTVRRAWYILPSWGKNGSFRIIGSEDNGQLGMVNPPLFPVNFWLISGEPRISQYGFLFAYVGQEETQFCGFVPSSCLEVGVVL